MISQTRARRYAKAKEIFMTAAGLDPAQHDEFVSSKCAGDAELQHEVRSLLAVRVEAGKFLESPALAATDEEESFKNKLIGGYRLVRKIGEGGMGIVFLAEKTDGKFTRRAALKIVKSNLHSQTVFKRFELERQILASLEHPNIAHLIDGGTTEDRLPFFVMEFVEGVSLNDYAERQDLPTTARIELFRQVCAAVSFAHQHGVIHRDLKPSNILVTSSGTPKLLDFGIAKLLSPEAPPTQATHTTWQAMTPDYASPEQIKGEIATTVSDVYSLGVILYRLLAGVRPYETDAENLPEMIRSVCEIMPEPPSTAILRRPPKKSDEGLQQKIKPRTLRGDLDKIILKALRKEPARRYESAEALSEDLRRHLAGKPVAARPDTFLYRAGKIIGRNRTATGFALLLLLSLAAGMTATSWQAQRAERERERAERRFNEVRSLANSFVFEFNDEILKGQTQAREMVVRRALEYLDNLAAEAKEDNALQRELSAAYLKIGDIQGKPYSANLGDTAGALNSYNKAVTIFETLVRDNPGDRQNRAGLATAYLSTGSLESLREFDKNKALQCLQKSRALAEDLTTAEPENPVYRRLLSDIYKSIGDSLENREERLGMQRQALDLREKLTPADPSTGVEDLTAAASIHQRIGTILEGKGDYADRAGEKGASAGFYHETLENFNQALTIYQKLQATDPNNSRYRRNLADMKALRLSVHAKLGARGEALKAYQTALHDFEDLAKSDPKNAEAQLDVVFTHRIMCKAFLRNLNDAAQAIRICRQGRQVGRSLLSTDPNNAEIYEYLISTSSLIAQAYIKERNSQKALQSHLEALNFAEKWLAAVPDNTAANYYIAGSRKDIGNIYKAMAGDAKTPAAAKKADWLSARHWFEESLNVFEETQQRIALREIDFEYIKEIRHQIEICDSSLKLIHRQD